MVLGFVWVSIMGIFVWEEGLISVLEEAPKRAFRALLEVCTYSVKSKISGF